MINDLKQIKKLYGEAMMHFCRDSFSTILEDDGLLLNLMCKNFASSHELYEDLISNGKITDFKNYIYELSLKKDEERERLAVPIPQELMRLTGYVLYECKTEEDIQAFKKYYAKGEELCTFNGERLKSCYVFFAVKENVDEIKREDFKKPDRQDLYGTSVISLQFTRDPSHILSIKNRYNHTVSNPDATFSNDLEQIIPGLTQSFACHYGLKQLYNNSDFEIPRYVRANDGKWYKYNFETNNVYYCPNNIIIDRFNVKHFEKEKYLVIGYFVLDLVQKEIYLYDKHIKESFADAINDIKKIEIKKEKDKKIVSIMHTDGKLTKIVLNKDNEMVELFSDYIRTVEDYFLNSIIRLKSISLPNLVEIEDLFLANDEVLSDVNLPLVKKIGNFFLYKCNCLKILNLPEVKVIDGYFLGANYCLQQLYLPKVETVGNEFLSNNRYLFMINAPNLQTAGMNFLYLNNGLKELELPKLHQVDSFFMYHNQSLVKICVPNLTCVGEYFLAENGALNQYDFSSLDIWHNRILLHHFKREEILINKNNIRVRQL